MRGFLHRRMKCQIRTGRRKKWRGEMKEKQKIRKAGGNGQPPGGVRAGLPEETDAGAGIG